MYTDQRKVVQKGENGEKEVTYKDRYVNGKLVKTTVDSEKVLKAAVNQKTLVGTLRRVNKIKLKNGLTPISDLKVPSYVKLDQNGVPTKYKKVVDGKAAAYSGGWGTASGRKAMPGHIAVDPSNSRTGRKCGSFQPMVNMFTVMRSQPTPADSCSRKRLLWICICIRMRRPAAGVPGRFASTFCNPLSFPQITEQKRRLAAVDCYAVHGGCFFPGMDLSALKFMI